MWDTLKQLLDDAEAESGAYWETGGANTARAATVSSTVDAPEMPARQSDPPQPEPIETESAEPVAPEPPDLPAEELDDEASPARLPEEIREPSPPDAPPTAGEAPEPPPAPEQDERQVLPPEPVADGEGGIAVPESAPQEELAVPPPPEKPLSGVGDVPPPPQLNLPESTVTQLPPKVMDLEPLADPQIAPVEPLDSTWEPEPLTFGGQQDWEAELRAQAREGHENDLRSAFDERLSLMDTGGLL